MKPFHRIALAFVALLSITASAEEDLRILVRGGCLDESNCCFGKWKMKSNADVYRTDDAIDKTGAVVAGQEVEGTSGRVHSDPGKLKVVFNHKEWKKGQIIGLYSEPDEDGRAQIGTVAKNDREIADFLKKGAKKCDAKPSKDCWGVVLSHPKVKWWIKVKLPEDKTGWVDSTAVAVDSECTL